jgi:N-acetyl-gamma-glutamyl-phosphate reductase
VIDLDEIVIDLKAAASGAGRSLKEHLLFAELFENVKGYSLGGTHRHLGEFDQEFSRRRRAARSEVQFTPHLIPDEPRHPRDRLRAGRCRSDTQDLARRLYRREVPQGPAVRRGAADEGCPGVELLPPRRGGDRIPGRAVVVATLDNLTKGSSGQAVQNANLMLGEDEAAGLMLAPLYP